MINNVSVYKFPILGSYASPFIVRERILKRQVLINESGTV